MVIGEGYGYENFRGYKQNPNESKNQKIFKKFNWKIFKIIFKNRPILAQKREKVLLTKWLK